MSSCEMLFDEITSQCLLDSIFQWVALFALYWYDQTMYIANNNISMTARGRNSMMSATVQSGTRANAT